MIWCLMTTIILKLNIEHRSRTFHQKIDSFITDIHFSTRSSNFHFIRRPTTHPNNPTWEEFQKENSAIMLQSEDPSITSLPNAYTV